MNLYRHGGRERPENSRDPRLAILIDAPDHTADIRDLHAIALPRDRPDDIRIRHEVVDIPLVHKGMPERDDLLAVDRRHRARRADAEIAVDKSHADRLTARKRRIIARMKLCRCARTAQRKERCPPHRKLILQIAQTRPVKAARKEICLFLRCIDRLLRCILGSTVVRTCSSIIGRCGFIGVHRCPLRLLIVQCRNHITPLCLTFFARHLRKDFLALTQAALFLGLLTRLELLHKVDRIDIRLILRIRHRPERCHILDRRDEERIGAEILQPGCQRANEAITDIDGTAAHPLQHTADLLDECAARPRHNHALRALAALHVPKDFNGKCTNLTRRVEHGIGRPLHSRRHLTVWKDGRHRIGGRRVKIQCKRKKRRRCKAFQRISQNVTSKKCATIEFIRSIVAHTERLR